MCDKLAISAYILKIVEKDPFLRLQMRAEEDFNRHFGQDDVSLNWILGCYTNSLKFVSFSNCFKKMSRRARPIPTVGKKTSLNHFENEN